MLEFFGNGLCDALRTNRQGAGIRGESYQRRLQNIEWIANLDRESLQFEQHEKQIRIHETERGESLYIQYPGKETIKEGEGSRPWDFRPKVLLPSGEHHVDMSFGDIWDGLFETLEPLETQRQELIRTLACLFYRMAFMCDHGRQEEDVMTKVRHFEREGIGLGLIREEDERLASLSNRPLYIYRPSKEVLSRVSAIIPLIGEISVEAFLFYNDLLAWNEDCKYYYRDVVLKKNTWHNAAGRVNNLLTHVSLLGWLVGEIRLSAFLSRFSTMRGVSPASFAEVVSICGGLVVVRVPGSGV